VTEPFALVRQAGWMDCGAAALATVALHYRRPVGLRQAGKLSGTRRTGTTLLGLLTGARELGFVARGVRTEYDALQQLPLPAIAHWTNGPVPGHYVVLHRVSAEEVVVADPAGQVRALAREEFCRSWSGHLLLLVPDPEPRPLPEAAASVRRGRHLLSCLGPRVVGLARGVLRRLRG
jgi:ATP-binding cassette subfamily B protein